MSVFLLERKIKMSVEAENQPAVSKLVNTYLTLSESGELSKGTISQVIQEKYNAKLMIDDVEDNFKVEKVDRGKIDKEKLEKLLIENQEVVKIWNDYINDGGAGDLIYSLDEDSFNNEFDSPYDAVKEVEDAYSFDLDDNYFVHTYSRLESSNDYTDLMDISDLAGWLLENQELFDKYHIEMPYKNIC